MATSSLRAQKTEPNQPHLREKAGDVPFEIPSEITICSGVVN